MAGYLSAGKDKVVEAVVAALGKLGLVAYLPTEKRPFHLLTRPPSGWPVVPLYVRSSISRRADFHLREQAARRLERANGVAMFSMAGRTWYLPVSAFLSVAVERDLGPTQDRFVIPHPTTSQTEHWLQGYEGTDGLR